ncbi:NAD(P)/FAD-dependent oxidoreductase [Thorsellia anophelis]|uniref:Amine oxidase domain-containing protein n=1 Tax=Thorsellia anophelis DSM 18579 TaxID=1123402 RepID=A0A1I0E0E1_9GAMM|nr:FAD-dependent oxidoreductase [Thorsellia anophelis]SET37758.1 hypothetical protein SAMN02583745_02180 [Thorsellia anophelis DSM 18579]
MNIAIIGAGLAGLVVASQLNQIANVTLFEKSRGVGGRLATRRHDSFVFDHGAQYFTARSHEFNTWLKPLIQADIVQSWQARYASFEGIHKMGSSWPSNEPRWVGANNMNSIAKHIASDLNIMTNTRIIKLERTKLWILTDETGQEYDNFDWVILNSPSPQALELLPNDAIFLNTLRQIDMTPCFALMLGFHEPLTLSFDCAHITQSDLSWIAFNHTKPNRPDLTSLVVHSSVDYALKHWEQDKEVTTQDLIHKAQELLGFNIDNIMCTMLHGWKFANTIDRKQDVLLVDPRLKIAACGDYCMGGRVEGAFLSAMKTANYIKKLIAT